MKLYHGTLAAFTDRIKQNLDFIDVRVGRGELGKGFYTSQDCGLVSIWAFEKYKQAASIIEFSIDEFEYTDLSLYIVKTRKEVLDIYKSNQDKMFNVDVVEGPFMSIESRIQHKFESTKSEIILNKSISRIK